MLNISIKLQIQFYYISASFHISCLLNTPTCQEPLKVVHFDKQIACPSQQDQDVDIVVHWCGTGVCLAYGHSRGHVTDVWISCLFMCEAALTSDVTESSPGGCHK